MTTHLADCTATELLALYQSGQASPREAHAAVVQRIDQLNPTLKAFCHLDHEASACER
jgi:aspartyl-tRNA(Asn)/glutamyl-tRNA(Gln) amidotransferase subunit A